MSPATKRRRTMSALLMKFGEREHLAAMRDRGLIYMNSESYFASLERDIARADPFESTDVISQPSDTVQITVDDARSRIVIPGCKLAGPVRMCLGRRPLLNLFCLYAITKFDATPLVDNANQAFGSSFIMILDTQGFVGRISEAAKAVGLQIACGLVTYYDASRYSGDTGPFRKPSRFAHQNEFRIVVSPGTREPRQLVIGSLKDISTAVLPLARVNELIKIPTWED